MWGKLGKNLLFAYCVVAVNWIFVTLFVALGVSLNNTSESPYETPVGVSLFCFIFNAATYAL